MGKAKQEKGTSASAGNGDKAQEKGGNAAEQPAAAPEAPKRSAVVEVGSDTVRMRFPTKRQTDECRAISVEGGTYKRQSDGSFIVDREHVQAMRQQGLDLAD